MGNYYASVPTTNALAEIFEGVANIVPAAPTTDRVTGPCKRNDEDSKTLRHPNGKCNYMLMDRGYKTLFRSDWHVIG